ncbi:hypothetical protein ACIPYS_15335 [Kitasatospora sp. NPDC089913]|uniref:hypothetical protein n=1 Tax=Kitasatospora sp. NPDC089913 TaxID=3364080 RepID=UPI0037F8F9AF
MTARVKVVLSMLVGITVALAMLSIWWFRSTSDRVNLEGEWRSGSYFLELRGDGKIGNSSLPAGICAGSRYSPRDESIELDGSWRKEFEADSGSGVRIQAIRKDGGGTCTFWASYDSGNAISLTLGTDSLPVKILQKDH